MSCSVAKKIGISCKITLPMKDSATLFAFRAVVVQSNWNNYAV